MTTSVIEKSCHRVGNDGENILERSGDTKHSVRSRSNGHERRRNRQIAKSKEHCNEKNLESTKVGCTSSNKRRDRNKQHEVENSEEQASIASYLRRIDIETGNNEVLKRILEDSKKNKKSKWWETIRKYMNWAQIED